MSPQDGLHGELLPQEVNDVKLSVQASLGLLADYALFVPLEAPREAKVRQTLQPVAVINPELLRPVSFLHGSGQVGRVGSLPEDAFNQVIFQRNVNPDYKRQGKLNDHHQSDEKPADLAYHIQDGVVGALNLEKIVVEGHNQLKRIPGVLQSLNFVRLQKTYHLLLRNDCHRAV